MKKFKVFWNFEAEEKYLNDMAQKGYLLKKYSMFGVYHFEEDIPHNLNYKIDYQNFKNKKDFNNYITLFEDAGWKHVYGTMTSYNQYFLPMSEQAGDDIFSDKESAAMRYRNLYKLCKVSVAAYIGYLLIEIVTVGGDLSKIAFLTPGLWERTGTAFWSAFFFELPFALLRVVPLIILIILAVMYTYWGRKAKESYELRIKGGEDDIE